MTPDQATADARQALAAAGVTRSRITSTAMGYSQHLGGDVIETSAKISGADFDAAMCALLLLPRVTLCSDQRGHATVYRLVTS